MKISFSLQKTLRLKKTAQGFAISSLVFEDWSWSFAFTGPVSDETGMIINLKKVEDIMKDVEPAWRDKTIMDFITEKQKVFDQVKNYLKGTDVRLENFTLEDIKHRQTWTFRHLDTELKYRGHGYFTENNQTIYVPFEWTWDMDDKSDPAQFMEMVFPAMDDVQWNIERVNKFTNQRNAKSLAINLNQVTRIFRR